MGTFRITGFTADAARALWLNEDYGWEGTVGVHSPTMDNEPPSLPSPTWGEIFIRLHTPYAQIYLDGSLTPTALEDLPDDFGIDSITYQTSPPWVTGVLPAITPNFPLCRETGNPGGGDVFKGGGSQYYWTIEPVGLGEYQLPGSGLVQSNILLADPSLGIGYPPVFTKWNGFLQSLLQQGTFRIVFSEMTTQYLAWDLFVFLVDAIILNTDGYLDIGDELWSLFGTYDSYPPPPNPTVYGAGGLAFGGAPTIQILSDASGIYTLTPGLYRDELWQRTGTVGTVTSFEIPQPFFKTGYIGGR